MSAGIHGMVRWMRSQNPLSRVAETSVISNRVISGVLRSYVDCHDERNLMRVP